jgi:hypothetical protein
VETIKAYYPWYYLNTYVTNVVGGQVYVVDGQQRLTTLSLILIKLRHMAQLHRSKLAGWIDAKMAGQSGFEQKFWINHVGHRSVCSKRCTTVPIQKPYPQAASPHRTWSGIARLSVLSWTTS